MATDPAAHFLLKLLAMREHTHPDLTAACRGINPEPVLRRLHAEGLVIIDELPGVPPADIIYGLTCAGEQYVAALRALPANGSASNCSFVRIVYPRAYRLSPMLRSQRTLYAMALSTAA